MKKKLIGIVTILAASIFLFTGCSGQQTSTGQPVKAEWIEAKVSGDTVSIPVASLEDFEIVHFRVPGPDGEIAFMGYKIDDDIHVRANICPPCRSIGFSLAGTQLVCDSCRTTFDADTGDGISGACVAYPKEAVRYAVIQGTVSMNISDLVLANQKTIEAGRS